MGWVGCESYYDYNMPRESINSDVFASLAADGASSQYAYKGVFKKIRFVDNKVYNGEAEAKAGIRRLQGDRDENIAVPYYDFDECFRENKEIKQLRERANAIAAKIRAEEEKSYPLTLTSKYLSCKKCGSKLNRKYLLARNKFEVNHCPLCDGDLRPASTIEHIANLNKNWQDAKDKWQKAESELTKKLSSAPEKYAIKRWLVNASLYVG